MHKIKFCKLCFEVEVQKDEDFCKECKETMDDNTEEIQIMLQEGENVW